MSIAGLGRMGSRHARNLATRVPNAHLVVACSPSAEERAWAVRELRVPQTCASYAELLRHPRLDAVFLATPTSEHAGARSSLTGQRDEVAVPSRVALAHVCSTGVG